MGNSANIGIVLPYKNAEKLYKAWAYEEDSIDFENDSLLAERNTISFAACELCKYLELLGFNAMVVGNISNAMQLIYIKCQGKTGEGFYINQNGKSIEIVGDSRSGALYGVYEFLEAQGIRWYSPWEEYIPDNISSLVLPKKTYYRTNMTLGRGFDFEGPLKESELLYLWMARNKLNLSTCRPNTKQLQRKLCMTFKTGGHIFEKMLEPTLVMPSGKTLIEEHSDWYGKSDEALCKENALLTQFCISNDELKEYLWQRLLVKLNNEWKDQDRIDVWGFDTWGNTCKCKNCTAIGNGADQMLHFLAFLRNRINGAIKTGTLKRNVILVMCAYEGTATIEPPTRDIPDILKNSGDYVVYYPIIRCYEHLMQDEACSYNSFYKKMLVGWKDIPIMIGEYYNVSKFEDLPIIFSESIPKDLRFYHSIGISGITYMHLPMVEWGMKALTQVLYAKLAYDGDADDVDIINRYFNNLYGTFSQEARQAYALTEKALKNCTSWRAWCNRSVLSAQLNWDGTRSECELYRDDHLGDKLIEKGLESVKMLKEAEGIFKEVQKKVDTFFALQYTAVAGVPLNPTDTRFRGKKNTIGERVDQDLRSISYAADVILLQTYFADYHQRLKNDEDTTSLWASIEALCYKMRSYCYGVKYKNPNPELNVVDALERSGLKDLYYRCLQARSNYNNDN